MKLRHSSVSVWIKFPSLTSFFEFLLVGVELEGTFLNIIFPQPFLPFHFVSEEKDTQRGKMMWSD